MINKTDLRIGNSVMLFLEINDYGAQFRIVKIFGINSDIIGDVKIRIDDTDHWHPLDNILPIPITEEALVKMGAIVTKKNNYNLNGMAITNFNGKFIEYVHQIELKGIHHLQNVYYFTRQTELTYEP